MSRLLDRVAAPEAPGDWLRRGQTAREAMGSPLRPEVGGSAELERVLALPRRPPKDLEGPEGEALADIMTERLARPPRACACAAQGHPCIRRLKPAQAWALYEAPLAGGLAGSITAGEGKTLLDILVALVMGVPEGGTVALFIPPGLRRTLLREYRALAEHFYVPSLVMGREGYVQPTPDGGPYAGRRPPVLHVIPYSKLSSRESSALLEQLKPHGVVLDESHSVKNPEAARTKRVLRYWLQHPGTWLCFWSGTSFDKSIKDAAHLVAWALGPGSPLPTDPDVVERWSFAVDPIPVPCKPGALLRLCAPGESPRDGLKRRMAETLGVVTTPAGSVRASLYLRERVPPALPEKIDAMLRALRASGERPDGEILFDQLEVNGCARELACGIYNKWFYPRGEPEVLIALWFNARKAWHAELREKLLKSEELLDSPALCREAAVRYYRGYRGELPVWHAKAWPAWRDIAGEVEPEPRTVWVDDWLARDAAAWAEENRGVVWYEHVAFGHRVAELLGVQAHGGGPGAEARILAEKGDRPVVASIAAHGTGRDGLQRLFDRALVTTPPASGQAWGQLLGRLHRIGQESDEVAYDVYRHVPEFRSALESALDRAEFAQAITGTENKLAIAAVDWL